MAIVLGGSGQGEAIVANRFPHVRAVVFNGQYVSPDENRDIPNEIVLSREHNDANILSLGARFLSEEEAKNAVRLWLATPFSHDERHIRRIAKIEQYPT
jgi:ribose 5-phosphate isomerase B